MGLKMLCQVHPTRLVVDRLGRFAWLLLRYPMFMRFLSISGRAPVTGICRFAAGAVNRQATPLCLLPPGAGAVNRPSAAHSQSGTEAKVVVNLCHYSFPVMPMSARDGRRSL